MIGWPPTHPGWWESYQEGDDDVESSRRLISSTFHHKTCATQPQSMRKPCRFLAYRKTLQSTHPNHCHLKICLLLPTMLPQTTKRSLFFQEQLGIDPRVVRAVKLQNKYIKYMDFFACTVLLWAFLVHKMILLKGGWPLGCGNCALPKVQDDGWRW